MLIISVESVAVRQGTPTVRVPVLVRQEDPASDKPLNALNLSFSVGIPGGPLIRPLPTGKELEDTVWPPAHSIAATAYHEVYRGLAAVATFKVDGAKRDGVLFWLTLDTLNLPKGLYPVDPNHIVNGVGTNTNLHEDGQFFVPGYIAIF